MEETREFTAVDNNHRSDAPPHTPISANKRSATPLTSPQSTPTLSCKGSWKHTHGVSAMTTVSSVQTENGAGFTVAAGDIPPRSWQASNTACSPCRQQQAPKMSKSTLNPDAKEFQLPCNAASDAFAATSTTMMRSTLPNGGGMSFPLSLFAVPSMMAPWQSLNGVIAEPVFSSSQGADVIRWPPFAASQCSPYQQDSGVTTATTASAISLAAATTTTTDTVSAVVGAAAPLSPCTLARQIMEEYASECRSNGYHMVAVFNLEPRTTEAELLTIFFPMGAKKAELLPSHRSLRPNRRAGVVFFPSKAFAAVAVKKLNDFVPNRQHQPLTVQYCGPDDFETVMPETATQPSTTTATATLTSQPYERQQQHQKQHVMAVGASAYPLQPWRLPAGAHLDRIHMEMWRFSTSCLPISSMEMKHVIAVHGLDPELGHAVLTRNFINKGAEGYDMWPAKTCSFVPTPLNCRSLSAILWYSQEAMARDAVSWFQLRLPEGQAQPIDVVHLNSLSFVSGSSMANGGKTCGSEACGKYNKSNDSEKDAVLDASTVGVFDGVDAFFMREYDDPKLHLVGVHNLSANSDKRDLFRLFSPHGALDAEMYHTLVNIADDVRASGVVFFDNEVAARKAAEKLDNFTPFKHPNPVVARYLVKPCTAETAVPSNTASVMTAEVMANALGDAKPHVLLLAVAEELHAPVVDASKLTEKMLLVITHPDSTEVMAGQLASIIVCTLTAMKHHAVTLSTPLVNTLLLLHEKLNIPRKGCKDTPTEGETQNPLTTRSIFFMQTIARALIQLLMDNTKPHESRKVVAVVCGYLFQFCYLMKSPYELAVKLMQANEKSLSLARECKGNGRVSENPAAFLDYEEEERKPWMTLMQCLDQMTSLWRQNNKSRAKKDPYRKEYERRVDEFFHLDASRTGGSSSLNTSARPTPRRVVAKVTPGSGGGYSSSSPGLTQPSPAIPRVSLGTSVGENSNMISHDISLDSLSPNPLTPAPYLSDLPSSMLPLRTDSDGSTTGFQQQRIVMGRPSLISDVATLMESMRPVPGVRGGVPVQSAYTHAELMERTVYITKLPCTLRRAQFRRLLLHFGEFNKVRLCRDDNQLQQRGDASALAAHSCRDSSPVALWFSFVEFSEPSSAKAMIEYFRNAMFNSQPFSFLFDSPSAWPEASHFTQQDIQPLLNARTSPARNPIHDQLPLDAVLSCTPQHPRLVLRNRPCLFGIECEEKTIDTGADAAFLLPSSPSAASSAPAGAAAAAASFSNPGGSRLMSSAPMMKMTTVTSMGEWKNVPRSSSAFAGVARRNSDAVDDDMDIESVMNSVVPTATRNMWVKESDEVAQHGDQFFSQMEVSWLKDVPSAPQSDDPWGGATFGDDFSTGLAAASGANRAADSDKLLWPPYEALFGNPLIDDECSDG